MHGYVGVSSKSAVGSLEIILFLGRIEREGKVRQHPDTIADTADDHQARIILDRTFLEKAAVRRNGIDRKQRFPFIDRNSDRVR